MTKAKKIYDTLGGKKAGDGYLVHCPVPGHGKGRGDKDPSLGVKQSEQTGKLIFKCFAGCKYGDIVSALKHKGLCRGIWSKETIADIYNYTDEKGRILYQLVKFTNHEERFRKPSPSGIHDDWVWNIKGVQRVLYNLPHLISAIKQRETIFLVEGEKDVETLKARGLYATTSPFGAGAKWRDSYTKTFKSNNTSIVVIPDNDEVGKRHAQKVLRALYGNVGSLNILELPDLGEGDDISDWLENGGAIKSLTKMVEQAEEWEPDLLLSGRDEERRRRYEMIEQHRSPRRKQIKDIEDRQHLADNDPEKLSREEVQEQVTYVLIHDMEEGGKFYRTRDNRFFWFNSISVKLFDIESEEFKRWFGFYYGMNKKTSDGKFFHQELLDYCSQLGEMTEIYQFVHYDSENNILYKFNNDDLIFRMDGDKIETVPNGTDGVLFEREGNADPIMPADKWNGNPLEELIFDTMNFEGDERKTRRQKYLFRYWFYGLFFPEVMNVKPLCLLWGIKGSGKSYALRFFLRLFYGGKAEVLSISKNKEEDFVTTLCNTYFVAIDNADEYVDFLNDYLAKAATGMEIRKRKLYTTNEMITYHPRGFISLLARTPKFRRDDVADRLLIFEVCRYKDFGGEYKLLREIKERRNEIWGYLLNHLNRIVKRLSNNDGENITTKFRLADFYIFVRRIINSKNVDVFDSIIGDMIKAQSDYALEGEWIFEILEIYMKEKIAETHSTGEWYAILNELATRRNKQFYKSARAFGTKLIQLEGELNSFYDVEINKGAHNIKLLTIRKKEEEL